MAEPASNGNSAVRGVGMLVAIIAIVGGIYTISNSTSMKIDENNRFTGQRISFMSQQIDSVEEKNTQLLSEIALIRVMLSKVRTQNNNCIVKHIKAENFFEWWYKNNPRLNAEQDSRISAIERTIHGDKLK